MDERKVVVFCSASYDIDPKYATAARDVVRALRALNRTVVSGGSFRGTMGDVADECHRLGVPHIGVLPRFMKGLEYPHLTDLIWTDTMSERKERMRQGADAVIALPAGNIPFEGKELVVCFMEIDMEEMLRGVSIATNNKDNAQSAFRSQLQRSHEH